MKEEFVAREEFVAVEVNGRRPFYRSVSWSAILAGLVVALVCQILLTMLGVAIGAATIQPLQENNPADGLGTGAAIWWFVTALLSLFIGAFVAGRVLGYARKKDGAVHGFLMWSSATALTFMLAGTVLGGMFGSGFSAISEPGNRREIMNKIDEINPVKDQYGYDDDRKPYDQAQRYQRESEADDNPESPATPYDAPVKDQYGYDDNRFDTANRSTPPRNQTEAADTSQATGAGINNNSADRNLNLSDKDNDRGAATVDVDDDDRPVIGSREEAELRESGEEAASATSKAALIGLGTLLIGALVCTWAGSKGVHDELEHPRDTRVTGGHPVPGEPVKG